MSRKRKKILIFSGPEGHKSLANVIYQLLEKHEYEIKIWEYEDPIVKMYAILYRFWTENPFQAKIYMNKSAKKNYRLYFSIMYDHQTKKAINEFKPNLIISTNHAFDNSLEKILKEKNIPYLNLICDPRTYSPLNVSSAANYNLCFDEYEERNIKTNYPDVKTFVIGWLVNKRYYTTYDKNSSKINLKIDPEDTVLLFTGGSEGVSKAIKLIKKLQLLNIKSRVHIFIACGKSKYIFNKAKRLSESGLANIVIKPLPFTDLLPYMQAADIVVGKAGPNTLFESVATLTPFFAYTYTPGQEAGNLEIIKEYNLGWVENDLDLAANKIAKLIEKTETLENLIPSLQKMANYNYKSFELLYSLTEKLLFDK